ELAEAAMQEAADGSELATAILDEGLRAAGAAGVALWRLEADGAVELAGHAGFDALEASRWRRIPPQMDALPQRVVRTGLPLWLGNVGTGSLPVCGPWTAGARAVLPLSGAKSLIGVLEVMWAGRRKEFLAGLRLELTTLAEICARALDFRLAVGEPT